MRAYLVRRVLLLIPSLLGVSLIVTGFLAIMPGDTVDILVSEGGTSSGAQATAREIDRQLVAAGIDPSQAAIADRLAVETTLVDEQLRRDGLEPGAATQAERVEARRVLGERLFKDHVRRQMGLDKSYLGQWWAWTSRAVRGDLGTSLASGRSINGELQNRIPTSAQLGIFALAVSAAIGLPVGIISAVKQDSWIDYLARSASICAVALPSFVFATIVLLISARWFNYSFPVFYESLWTDPITNLQLTLVPALILGGSLSGSLMRFTRAQMLEVMREDYMRTAHAKGLKSSTAVLRHAVRNAFIPVVTVIGLQVPVLVGGSLVVEQIFGIPGVANYMFTAIGLRDFTVIISVNMVVALTVMCSNLLVDISYALLDPRIRAGAGAPGS